LRYFVFLALASLLIADPSARIVPEDRVPGGSRRIETRPSNDPAVGIWPAAHSSSLGEYQKAQEWFEKAAQAEPKHGGHMAWLGKTLGRRAGASQRFHRAPNMPPNAGKRSKRRSKSTRRIPRPASDLLEYISFCSRIPRGGFEKATMAAEKNRQVSTSGRPFVRKPAGEKQRRLGPSGENTGARGALTPDNAGRWMDLSRFLAQAAAGTRKSVVALPARKVKRQGVVIRRAKPNSVRDAEPEPGLANG
jgi:hypothetical protein